MGYGSNFQSTSSPQAVVKVGASTGASGVVEVKVLPKFISSRTHVVLLSQVTDMLFTTRGPAAGAIVVEWNVADPSGTQGGSGTWDTLIRIGGGERGLHSRHCQISCSS